MAMLLPRCSMLEYYDALQANDDDLLGYVDTSLHELLASVPISGE